MVQNLLLSLSVVERSLGYYSILLTRAVEIWNAIGLHFLIM